jgi:hypothetical protein
MKLMDEEWKSRGSADVAADGTLRFRGFFGEYRIIPDAEPDRQQPVWLDQP